jgi:DNA-binding MarR family transcriptional regulator
LARHGAASLGELTASLSMSLRAALRHLDKLERRGFLRRKRVRRTTAYVLTQGKGPLQRAVFKAVLDHLTPTPQ